MTEYSYCRNNGTRRKTKNKKTIEESCDINWEPWQLEKVGVKGSCGCGICEFEYKCSSNNCGPRDDIKISRTCAIDTCDKPYPKCRQQGKIYIGNRSKYVMYAIIQWADIHTTYILNTYEDMSVDYVENANINIGRVGFLNTNQFLRATPTTGILQNLPKEWNVEGYFSQEEECCTIEILDLFQPCENLNELTTAIDDTEEQTLLGRVQQEFNSFIESKTLEEVNQFLDGALVSFSNEETQTTYYPSNGSNDKKGFALKTGSNITYYKWTSLSKNAFKLTTDPGNVNVSICSKTNNCSDLFQLSLITSGTTNSKADFLTLKASLFPTTNFKNAIGFGQLPFALNGLFPGLDNVSIVIKSLSANSRNQFLDSSTEAARQCCGIKIYANYDFAICSGSKYSSSKNDFATCDAFVNDYCTKTELKTKEQLDFCSCYSNVPIEDPIQRQVVEVLKSKDVDVPRKCIVKPCKFGYGYQNAAMKKEECVGLCLQIQNAITNGDLSNIDFKGIQTLECGERSIRVNALSYLLAIVFFTLGAISIVIGCITLAILKRYTIISNNSLYAIPVTLGIICLLFGFLFEFNVIKTS